MTNADLEKWNAKYASAAVAEALRPDDWLMECCRNLPAGRALDLACGLGHNAVWLATQGWQVDAVDFSPRGLELARQLAEQRGVQVNWICADLDEWQPAPRSYDLISAFRFLDRSRMPQVVANALSPGGRLCYETFSSGQLLRGDNHLRDSRFTLQPGELRELYAGLTIVTEHEIELDDRTVARLLAIRPTLDANSG